MNNIFHSTKRWTKRWTKRRTGIPPSAMCLVTLSVAFLALGATSYVMALPTLLPQSATQETVQGSAEDESAQGARKDHPESNRAGGASPEENSQGQGLDQSGQIDDGDADKSNAGKSDLSLPDLSLDSVDTLKEPSENDSPEDNAALESDESNSGGVDGPGHDEGTASQPNPKPEPAPDADSGSGSGSGADVEDDITSAPSEEEESRFREHLLKYANKLPAYVSEVNACVAAFEQTCLSEDYSVRTRNRSSCVSLFNTLLSEFVSVRDYPRSNESQYTTSHDSLINMYRCLFSYVDNYVDAWDANLAYEDPSGHVDDFMAPLYANMVNGKNKFLAEFEACYQGFTI